MHYKNIPVQIALIYVKILGLQLYANFDMIITSQNHVKDFTWGFQSLHLNQMLQLEILWAMFTK